MRARRATPPSIHKLQAVARTRRLSLNVLHISSARVILVQTQLGDGVEVYYGSKVGFTITYAEAKWMVLALLKAMRPL